MPGKSVNVRGRSCAGSGHHNKMGTWQLGNSLESNQSGLRRRPDGVNEEN